MYILLRVKLYIILFLLSASSLLAQRKNQYLLDTDKAIEDVEWLQNFITDVHIDPFAVAQHKQWTERFDSLKVFLNELRYIDRASFYMKLLPVFYELKDIHLSLYLPPHLNETLKIGKYYLNLKIKILNDELFSIDKNIPLLPNGSKIVSINGKAASDIVENLKQISPSDGINNWSRSRIAEKNFVEMLPLIVPLYEQNEIVFVPYGGHTYDTIKVEGTKLTKKSFINRHRTKEKNFHEFLYIHSLNTAVVSIPSFSDGSTIDFEDFLYFVFSKIKQLKVENVILDLRNNEGGYAERGEMLLAYLLPDEAIYVSNIIFKKSRMADEIFNKQSGGSELVKRMFVLRELFNLKDKPYGTMDTVFYKMIKPNKLNHSYKLYVLINGLSISTTGLVCNSLRQYGRAIFIGEPGGFTPQGTFGQVIRFELPHSGIIGFISTIRFNSTTDFRIGKEPFMPDILIEETIEDYVQGNDRVMDFTLNIIRSKIREN